MTLSGIIQKKIKEDGPISFCEFMEMSLYYPELGYYNSKGNKVGVDGDFYTSPCLTSIFGLLIGKQLEEMWNKLGNPEFTIVEYGAGNGKLCYDILDYLKSNESMYRVVKYCIIEKSHAMITLEQSYLSEKVEWHNSIENISGFTGCVLSNELLDNFAVHRVVQQKELMEVMIEHRDDGFREILQPAPEELKQYFKELHIDLPEDYKTEINLQAIDWLKEVTAALRRGYVLTIDYGYLTNELYKQHKGCDTLLSYAKHTINDRFYDCIGQQDITAHVNFSALMHWGEKVGLRTYALAPQGQFLLAMGFPEYVQHLFANEPDTVKAALKASQLSYTLLIDMGTKFKILLQGKCVVDDQLSGFSDRRSLTAC